MRVELPEEHYVGDRISTVVEDFITKYNPNKQVCHICNRLTIRRVVESRLFSMRMILSLRLSYINLRNTGMREDILMQYVYS